MAVFDGGGWGVEPPAKISDPPAAIKKRKGEVDFLCTYALARSSTSIAKTSTPLMKFNKSSPGRIVSYRKGSGAQPRHVVNPGPLLHLSEDV